MSLLYLKSHAGVKFALASDRRNLYPDASMRYVFLPTLPLAVALVSLLVVHDARSEPELHYGPWGTATATAYSTQEALVGCNASGCHTACGSLLNDRAYTVAANPALGLGCEARVEVCQLAAAHGAQRDAATGSDLPRLKHAAACHLATVTDRTGSAFSFEFSRALAYATGQRGAAWDSPRMIRWRRVYR